MEARGILASGTTGRNSGTTAVAARSTQAPVLPVTVNGTTAPGQCLDVVSQERYYRSQSRYYQVGGTTAGQSGTTAAAFFREVKLGLGGGRFLLPPLPHPALTDESRRRRFLSPPGEVHLGD